MMDNLLARRRFLVLTGGTAATTIGAVRLDDRSAVAATLDPAPFTLGVASGDPEHDSVVLWTRLAPDPDNDRGGMPDRVVPVRWEVAKDQAFQHVVRRGVTRARPEFAHAVHVVADELGPDRWYWYRFEVDGVRSRVGRTRTLPAPGRFPGRLRFAFASCQAWAGGPYPAYRDMAEHDLDLVIHLGDYIYETVPGSLAEFRRLHALYKSSPDLREAHARFPFVLTWDDHEVQNNYAGDVAGGSGDGRPFLERRANGYRAYYEHLPLRPPGPAGPDLKIYKRFMFGRLAEFSVLDTRQYRSDQACGDGRRPPCDEVYDEDRTMTGPEQERWLLDGLARSRARWNVIAQQTIMAAFDYDLGPGQVYNLDQWDGYPAARDRILGAITRHQPSNPVVISGDWHSHWVNDLLADFAEPGSEVLATEFAGTSISSGIGWDADVRQGLAANPHVKFYNGSYRGYVLCDVTPDRWQSTLRIVLNPGDAASPAYTIAAFEVRDGVPGARRIDGSGDGLVGTVTSQSGAELVNVEIAVLGADGSVVVRTATDPAGDYLAFVPPGDYTLVANAAGYEPASQDVTVHADAAARVDFSLARSGVYARTGRTVPGPRSEGSSRDIALGNELLAMLVSAVTDDGQLPGATRGKPIDLAGVGHLDQIDWFNLPFVAASQPTGTEAWQRGLVQASSVEVVPSEPGRAAVRTVGVPGEVSGVDVTTLFTVAAGEPWVVAESVLTNRGTSPVTVWVGDVIDHDGAGQRSGVPGHGVITTPYGSPAPYPPSGRWIGMTGTDRQTYGLIYADADFLAYGTGNWIMSQRQATLAPGGSWVARRRIAVLDSGTSADPFAVLNEL